MKNRINLNKYQIRTDLIIENNNVEDNNLSTDRINDNIKVTSLNVDESLTKKTSKKKGLYITIEFKDITNHEDKQEIKKVVIKEIKNILLKLKINKEDSGLIIGLGNKASTADSIGPQTIDKVLVTRHLFTLDTNVKEGIRNISAIAPGVMATTGIETYDIINSIINKIKPSFLIVIDSLASSSIERINRTIQLTDTGIHPGSGVGNNRKEISYDTIGIPVIAIGVPTVVESSTIVNDTINYLFKHISYLKNNYELSKLIIKHNNDYVEKLKELELPNNEKKELIGILGELNDIEKKQLISEVLTNLDYNLIVTPKEIDFLVKNISEVLADSINNALHKEVNNY